MFAESLFSPTRGDTLVAHNGHMPATSSVGATSGAAPTELWRLASPISYQDAALNRASANMRIPI